MDVIRKLCTMQKIYGSKFVEIYETKVDVVWKCILKQLKQLQWYLSFTTTIFGTRVGRKCYLDFVAKRITKRSALIFLTMIAEWERAPKLRSV